MVNERSSPLFLSFRGRSRIDSLPSLDRNETTRELERNFPDSKQLSTDWMEERNARLSVKRAIFHGLRAHCAQCVKRPANKFKREGLLRWRALLRPGNVSLKACLIVAFRLA